jgi:hypothetical protein
MLQGTSGPAMRHELIRQQVGHLVEVAPVAGRRWWDTLSTTRPSSTVFVFVYL